MTALATANGHTRDVELDELVDGQLHDPIEAAERAMRQRLDDHAHGLRQELTAASKQRMDLERLLAVAKGNERRIAAAITALEREDTQKPGPKPATSTPHHGGKQRASGKNWTISEERVQAVQRRWVDYWSTAPREPITKMQFARIMREQYRDKIGDETVAKVFDVLREREVVRKCGTTRGGGVLYAIMPGVADAA